MPENGVVHGEGHVCEEAGAAEPLHGEHGVAHRGDLPHHGDAVADGEHLVEAVRAEEDARALGPQVAGNLEQALHLDVRQRGGRLIHDEHRGALGDGLGDLDDPLVGDRQSLGRSVGIDAHAELVEQVAAAVRMAARLIRPSRPFGWRPMKMFSATVRSGNRVRS